MSIVDDLKKSHMDMLGAIQGLNPDELTKENAMGYWSVRDVILHIAMWEGEVIKALSVWRTGHQYDWTYAGDIQMFNEFFIEAGRDLHMGQVLQMFNLIHSALVADVSVITDEIWEKRGEPDWLRDITIRHNEEHVKKINKYKVLLNK
ncbi:MAG: hypothetical protein JSU85_08645 [Candidatus Zixiibacteriota bacterium]|nr:MAG: hypothetical protein JSU85_08645 [candidate division Zixibacteria bacterium]